MNTNSEEELYATNPDDFLANLPEIDPEDAALADPEEEAVEEVVAAVTKPKKPKNYINNADLLIQLAKSKEQDQMTNHLVLMLQTLCDRYGAKHNFSGYSYIEDMKAYAMFMIVRTWRAFKPEKSSNPFAFFTQCVKHSFIQYIKKEHNERDVRDLLLVENGLNPSYAYDGDDGDGHNPDY